VAWAQVETWLARPVELTSQRVSVRCFDSSGLADATYDFSDIDAADSLAVTCYAALMTFSKSGDYISFGRMYAGRIYSGQVEVVGWYSGDVGPSSKLSGQIKYSHVTR
jgi:hypothetical protein